MARPRIVIDREQVRKLAGIDCTHSEIAAVTGISLKTLKRRCRKELEEGKEQGRASLRRKQYELAVSGNATMLIWLGKQRLGQKDIQALSGDTGGPIRHVIEVIRQPLAAVRDDIPAAVASRNGANGNGAH